MQRKEEDNNMEEAQENVEDVKQSQKLESITASSMMGERIQNDSEVHQTDEIEPSNRKLSFSEKNADEKFETSLFKKSKGNYAQEYEKMKDLIQLKEQISVQEIEKIKDQLLLHNIKISKENIGDQCLVEQIIRHSYRVFEIRIRMGIFSVQISVFSLHQVQYKFDPSKKYNPENKIKQKQFLFQEDDVCQKFQNIITADTSPYNIKLSRPFFLMFLKELAFTKIFSVLRIGPKLCFPLGFDMIRYKNGFTFTIQKCYPIQLSPPTENKAKFKYEKIIYKKDIDHLKKNLNIMHSLKILHADIKQANIMYSMSWGQCVFIDFGICNCVKQGPNQGTLIKGWMGPKIGLSDQMKEIKDLKKTIITNISFYINDLHLFSKFITQCYYQLNPEKDPYENKIKNFADPYQNALLEIIEDKQLSKGSIFKVASTDLLWMRFFYHFYIGDYKKMKNEIQFLVNHSEPNLSKDEIMNSLNSALIKMQEQVKNCFYLNDLNPQIQKFFEDISQLKLQHKDLYDFNKNAFFIKTRFQNEQIVESLFYSVKKDLVHAKDLLIEDLTNNFISLIHEEETANIAILKPNFYEVQKWFLDQKKEEENPKIQKQENDESFEPLQFDTRNFIEKYLFFISFRRRIGTSTFGKRKDIADYFNKKMKSFSNFYLEDELNNTGLILSYNIAQIFFKMYLKEEYPNFEPFLDSYWIILVWIFRDKKMQQIKDGSKEQKLLTIKLGTQILYNLALCGYYNEELHVLVGEWITQLLDSQQNADDENEQKAHEGFTWMQKLNNLLKLKEVRELSFYTTSFPFLHQNRNMSTESSGQQNSLTKNDQQQHFGESKVKNTSYYQFQMQYFKKYQIFKTSPKLQEDAILLYQQFLQYMQHNQPLQKLRLITEKSQTLLDQNPQQILQLYKIINVTYVIRSRIRKPAEIFSVINKCKLYSVYEKQSPVSQLILDSLDMTLVQKKRLRQQYKDAYFQPEMFVIMSFLKLMSQMHSTIELLMYEKIDNLIWYDELSKYIFLLQRLRKNLIQKVTYFVKVKMENVGLSQENQVVIPPLKQLADFSLIKKLKNHKALMRTRNKFYQPSDVDFLFRTLQFLNQNQFDLKNQEDKDEIKSFVQIIQNEFNEIAGNFFTRMMARIKFNKKGNLQALLDMISLSEIFIKSSYYKFEENSNTSTQKKPQTESSAKSKREKTHEIVFESFLKEIQLKSRQINIFIRDPSKSLDQIEYAQLLLMLLTVAQIRINLHLQKWSTNLSMLMNSHEYLALKLKSFPELFQMVTYTLKNLNINVILFYIVDTFVRCIEAEEILIRKQLQIIFLEKEQSLRNKLIQPQFLKKDFFLPEFRPFRSYEDIAQTNSINQSIGKTEVKSFIISQKSGISISERQLEFSQVDSFYPDRNFKNFQILQKDEISETQKQKDLKRLLKTLNQELTQDNSRLNSTILMMYEEFKNQGQRQILFAKYIKTANQLCQIFTSAIYEINNKKQKDFFVQRWYKKIKPEQNIQPKYDPFVSQKVQRIKIEEKNVFHIMWTFLLILTKKYSLQYSDMYLGELINLYRMNFQKLGFVTLLNFIQFIYKNVRVCFETRPQNLILSVKASQISIGIKTKLSETITSIDLRYLPLILSLANQQLIKAFEFKDNNFQKDAYPQLAQIFMRNSLAINFLFLRNCVLNNPNAKTQPQLPLYFCRKIQDKGLVTDSITKAANKNLTSAQVEIQFGKKIATQIQQNKKQKKVCRFKPKFSKEIVNPNRAHFQQFDLFYSKKDHEEKKNNFTVLSKDQIAIQIQKILTKESIFTKIRDDSKIVMINMKSYIQNFVVQCKNQYEPNLYLERVSKLAIDTRQQLLRDRQILLKVEFMHFYTIIGKSYDNFNYFFQLAGKVNRNQLFSKIALQMNLVEGESSRKAAWMNLYKRNKKRSNIFNLNNFSWLVDLQKLTKNTKKQAQESFLMERNESENISYSSNNFNTNKSIYIFNILRKKSRTYKAAYARLILHRLGILK